jgi:CubicO group peptidase (beta-lactamase class C family)
MLLMESDGFPLASFLFAVHDEKQMLAAITKKNINRFFISFLFVAKVRKEFGISVYLVAMKTTIRTIFVLCSIVIYCVAWTYKKGDSEQHVILNASDSSIQKLLAEYPVNTQFSVVVIDNGKETYHGFIKKQDGIQAINNKHNFFEIGSLTKTFTAALVAHCFQKGLLKPSTTLKEVFSFPMPEDVGNISLQQLGNHTSGLPRMPSNLKIEDATNPYKDYDTTQLFAYLTKAKLQNKAGTVYSYSNLGMALLGEICAAKLDLSYEKALQQFVLNPLNMAWTCINATHDEQQMNMVYGLNAEGEQTSNWDFDCMAGAGAIKSNVEEMMLYAKANLDANNPLFNLCHQPTFKSNERMSVGIGWHIIKTNKGNEVLFHNGGTGGYTSSMMLSKEKKKAVVILSNVSAFHPKMGLIDVLCGQLLEN